MLLIDRDDFEPCRRRSIYLPTLCIPDRRVLPLPNFPLPPPSYPFLSFLPPPSPPYSQILPAHPLNGSDAFPPLLPVPELEEPDPLPGAQRQFPVRDGHADRGPDERGFDVCLWILRGARGGGVWGGGLTGMSSLPSASCR